VVVGQLGQHPGEGSVAGLDPGQERREGVPLGARHRGEGIEAGEDQALLGLAEFDIDDRHAGLAAADRQLDPEVAVDDVARRPVHEDLRHPADLGQRARESRLLLLGVEAPVGRVRQELLRGLVAVADDPVAPRGRGRGGA